MDYLDWMVRELKLKLKMWVTDTLVIGEAMSYLAARCETEALQ